MERALARARPVETKPAVYRHVTADLEVYIALWGLVTKRSQLHFKRLGHTRWASPGSANGAFIANKRSGR